MARKFSQIEFEGSVDEINAIIDQYFGNRIIIEYSYVRDNRYIDIKNQKVYIGNSELPDFSYQREYLSTSNYFCGDLLKNAYFDVNTGTLRGKMIYIDAFEQGSNGIFKIKLVDDYILDFINGRCNFTCKTDDWIQDIAQIEGAEWFVKEINEMIKYFPCMPQLPQEAFVTWHFIQKYNIYNLMPNYARLIDEVRKSRYKYPMKDDMSDFFEALSLCPDFAFSVSDEYWCNKSTSDNVPDNIKCIQTSEDLYDFYSNISSEEAKLAIIHSAENKYFSLFDLYRGMSSTLWKTLYGYVEAYPEFFKYYISNPELCNKEQILAYFIKVCRAMIDENITPSKENLNLLLIHQQASSKEMSIGEYIELQKSLDTKEGLVNCFKKFV